MVSVALAPFSPLTPLFSDFLPHIPPEGANLTDFLYNDPHPTSIALCSLVFTPHRRVATQLTLLPAEDEPIFWTSKLTPLSPFQKRVL